MCWPNVIDRPGDKTLVKWINLECPIKRDQICAVTTGLSEFTSEKTSIWDRSLYQTITPYTEGALYSVGNHSNPLLGHIKVSDLLILIFAWYFRSVTRRISCSSTVGITTHWACFISYVSLFLSLIVYKSGFIPIIFVQLIYLISYRFTGPRNWRFPNVLFVFYLYIVTISIVSFYCVNTLFLSKWQIGLMTKLKLFYGCYWKCVEIMRGKSCFLSI